MHCKRKCFKHHKEINLKMKIKDSFNHFKFELVNEKRKKFGFKLKLTLLFLIKINFFL